MTDVLSTTPLGTVAPNEAPTVAIYGTQEAMKHRSTARVRVPDGHVHLDIYRAENAGGESAARASVIFVGGLSNHALGYSDFQCKLAQRGYDVIALDLRGHGRSSGASGDFTMQTVVEDLRAAAAFARSTSDLPVAVMGSSLGGFYSLVAANAIDDICCAVSHWIYHPDHPVTEKDRRLVPVVKLLDRIAPWMKIPTKTIANWDAVSQDPEIRQRCFDDPMMAWKYSVRGLASTIKYKPRRSLTNLRVPHLVVIGEEDQMTPMKYTRGIYDQLTGDKEWHAIPGAGHMGGLVEFQSEMLDTVDDFLSRKVAAVSSAATR